jgi:hypothetical protein
MPAPAHQTLPFSSRHRTSHGRSLPPSPSPTVSLLKSPASRVVATETAVVVVAEQLMEPEGMVQVVGVGPWL